MQNPTTGGVDHEERVRLALPKGGTGVGRLTKVRWLPLGSPVVHMATSIGAPAGAIALKARRPVLPKAPPRG